MQSYYDGKSPIPLPKQIVGIAEPNSINKVYRNESQNGVWNVFYCKDQQRFFYAEEDNKNVTWTRPPDFDRELERKTFIHCRITNDMVTNEIPTHEIPSAVLHYLTHLSQNDYLYQYFNIPADDIEALIRERCAIIFRSLLDEKMAERDDQKRLRVNSSFEAANKMIQTDKRYNIVPRPSERKAIYQAWKSTAGEREAVIRKAYYEMNLNAFTKALQQQKKFRHDMLYTKAHDCFSKEPFWKVFNDYERRRSYELAKKKIMTEKKEREEEIRGRNMESLGAILLTLPEINHSTSWAAAQRLLLESESFNGNKYLLKMDKVDALDVFSNYKKSLQQEYRQTISKDTMQQSRRERKIRDTFRMYLLEMRQRRLFGMKTKWKEFLPMANSDPRYIDMCSQPGPTALDYFKFLQEDWKEEFARNMEDLKELFVSAKYTFNLQTTLDVITSLIRRFDVDEKIKPHNIFYLYEKLMQEEIEVETAGKKVDEEKLRMFFLDEIKKLEEREELPPMFDDFKKLMSAFIPTRPVLRTCQAVYDEYMLEKKEGQNGRIAKKLEEMRREKEQEEMADSEAKVEKTEKKLKSKKEKHRKRKHHENNDDGFENGKKSRRDTDRGRDDGRHREDRHRDDGRRRSDDNRVSDRRKDNGKKRDDDKKHRHRSRRN